MSCAPIFESSLERIITTISISIGPQITTTKLDSIQSCTYFFFFFCRNFRHSGFSFGENVSIEMSRRHLIFFFYAIVLSITSAYGGSSDILTDIGASDAENVSSSVTTMEPPTVLSSLETKGTRVRLRRNL